MEFLQNLVYGKPLPLEEAQHRLRVHIANRDASGAEKILKINRKDSKELVNLTTTEGNKDTLLQVCIMNQDVAGVKVLLKYGANPRCCNMRQASALHTAVANAVDRHILGLIIAEDGVQALYVGDCDKNTPLHCAITNNKPDALQQLLLSIDSNGDVRDLEQLKFKNADDNTPLNLSLELNMAECTIQLLKFPNIAKVNASRKGESPIHIATKKGDLQLVTALIDLKADPHVIDSLGKTALHFAVELSLLDIVSELISNNANVLTRDHLGNTPLHYCNNVEICKLLVDRVPHLPNLKFHLANKNGELPFQYSSSSTLTGLFNSLPVNDLSTSFTVQICSDLHIEFPHTVEITPNAPYIALLGDIGLCSQPKYRTFLLDCAAKFKKVFVILGNHEFYRFNVESAIKTAEDICKSRDNLIFMNRTSLVVDGVRVLGCTLWSDIQESQKQEIAMCLSDYKVIRIDCEAEITPANEITKEWKESFDYKGRNLKVDDTHRWHKEEREWLQQQILLAKQANEKVVVFTHHCPVLQGDSSSDDIDSRCRSAFSSDLTSMFGSPLVAWCYGHTHWYNDVTINGTRVISNPHGYPREKVEKKAYDPLMTISI